MVGEEANIPEYGEPKVRAAMKVTAMLLLCLAAGACESRSPDFDLVLRSTIRDVYPDNEASARIRLDSRNLGPQRTEATVAAFARLIRRRYPNGYLSGSEFEGFKAANNLTCTVESEQVRTCLARLRAPGTGDNWAFSLRSGDRFATAELRVETREGKFYPTLTRSRLDDNQ
jgi:hypothetical protein